MLNKILGKEIAVFVKKHKILFYWSLVFTLLFSFFSMIPLLIIKTFIEIVLGSNAETVPLAIPWIAFGKGGISDYEIIKITLMDSISRVRFMGILLIIYAVSIIFKSISEYASGLFTAAFSNRAITDMRTKLFNTFLSLHQGFYHKHKIGNLISRSTADLSLMQTTIAHILIGIIQNPILVICYLCFLFYTDWKMSLIVLFAGPVIIVFTRLFGRKVKKHAKRLQDATAEVTSSYQESLLCLKVIQGLCSEDIQSQKFRQTALQLYKKVMNWYRWQLGLSPMMEIISHCVALFIMVIGYTFFDHSAGDLAVIFYAFSRVYAPIKNLTKINNDLKTLQGSTERVFGIMNTQPSIKDNPGAIELATHKYSVEFRNVSFSYEPGNEVLKNISFNVKAGEMVAFVGSTGAGKSTLIDLIPRFYDVTDGTVIVDNIDIRDITIKSLRKQIGIVHQEVLLFNDSIANNINCGFSDMNMEAVIEAAKKAHAHDFIIKFPDGYKTIVGDRGTLLSGGQKQRIAIARAILMNSNILLLDEVASALDAESEELIQKSIESLKGRCTIFAIAHRLSTIRNADRIFVLENGEIVESGTHKELMNKNGRFRQLYDMQFHA